MTKLIVGLGNPGKKYQKNRHNIGFMVLDALAEKFDAKFEVKKKYNAEIAAIQENTSRTILAKPLTFMNDSGLAVKKLYTIYEIRNTDLLIVHDEIDLALGKIKPGSGRSAGHKGIDSVIQAIGSGFARLRIGIENRKAYRIPPTEDYVLQNFTPEELKKFKENIIPKAIDEIKKWMNLKIEN